jgi:hypothetical protein
MIILDLDNCISDDGWRMKFIKQGETDMDKKYGMYHDLCLFDRPKNLEALPDTERIIILTSRPIRMMSDTEWWLRKHNIKFSILMMRPETKEGVGSVELKRGYMNRLRGVGIIQSNIIRAYDDRLDILKMYESFGVKTKHLFINERS